MSKQTLSLSPTSLPPPSFKIATTKFGPFIGAVISKSSTVEISLSSSAASGLFRVPPIPRRLHCPPCQSISPPSGVIAMARRAAAEVAMTGDWFLGRGLLI